MKVIEGEFRVVSEGGVPVEPVEPVEHPAKRFARRLPRPVRYVLTRPLLWVWVGAFTVVGLTEGLW